MKKKRQTEVTHERRIERAFRDKDKENYITSELAGRSTDKIRMDPNGGGGVRRRRADPRTGTARRRVPAAGPPLRYTHAPTGKGLKGMTRDGQTRPDHQKPKFPRDDNA